MNRRLKRRHELKTEATGTVCAKVWTKEDLSEARKQSKHSESSAMGETPRVKVRKPDARTHRLSGSSRETLRGVPAWTVR